jgi:hypothetical protein
MTDQIGGQHAGRLVAVGRVGLTGLRGKVAQRVSGPVARRTSLTREQIEALIGGVFLLVTLAQMFGLLRRIARAARNG